MSNVEIHALPDTATAITQTDFLVVDVEVSPGVWETQKITGGDIAAAFATLDEMKDVFAVIPLLGRVDGEFIVWDEGANAFVTSSPSFPIASQVAVSPVGDFTSTDLQDLAAESDTRFAAVEADVATLEGAGTFFSITTTDSITTETTEVELMSGVLGAGATVAGDQIIIELSARLTNNTGSTSTCTWRFKCGGTTLITSPAFSYTTTANVHSSIMRITMTVIDADTIKIKWEVLSSNAVTPGSSNNTMGEFNSNRSGVVVATSDGVFAIASANTFSMTGQVSVTGHVVDVIESSGSIIKAA